MVLLPKFITVLNFSFEPSPLSLIQDYSQKRTVFTSFSPSLFPSPSLVPSLSSPSSSSSFCVHSHPLPSPTPLLLLSCPSISRSLSQQVEIDVTLQSPFLVVPDHGLYSGDASLLVVDLGRLSVVGSTKNPKSLRKASWMLCGSRC